MTEEPERCSKCGQRLPGSPPCRICSRCKTPIGKYEKFTFTPDHRVRHRCCKHRTSYCSGEPEHERVELP